jgi:predicted Zn-dependent protease with MMP-like domain
MPVFTNPRRMPCFGIAPTLEDFEAIAAEALATIPEEFRRHVGNVRIQVDDFPSDEVEKEMDLETPFDLLGLYQGVSMMERGAGHVANDIDRIFLYRRPILDYWCESGEDLPHIVRHVLIHEIGHHFGLSDDDMEAIEAKAEEESQRVTARTPSSPLPEACCPLPLVIERLRVGPGDEPALNDLDVLCDVIPVVIRPHHDWCHPPPGAV